MDAEGVCVISSAWDSVSTYLRSVFDWQCGTSAACDVAHQYRPQSRAQVCPNRCVAVKHVVAIADVTDKWISAGTLRRTMVTAPNGSRLYFHKYEHTTLSHQI